MHESLDWNHFKKRFTNHRNKTNHLLLFEDIYLRNHSEDSFENFNVQRDADKREADLQEKAKMASLYCDIDENGIAIIPDDIISKDLCEMSLNLLKNRLNLVSSFENEISCKIDIDKLKKEDIENICKKIGFKKD
nr:AbiV family abortive infection protein [Methanosarcina siciliae]